MHVHVYGYLFSKIQSQLINYLSYFKDDSSSLPLGPRSYHCIYLQELIKKVNQMWPGLGMWEQTSQSHYKYDLLPIRLATQIKDYTRLWLWDRGAIYSCVLHKIQCYVNALINVMPDYDYHKYGVKVGVGLVYGLLAFSKVMGFVFTWKMHRGLEMHVLITARQVRYTLTIQIPCGSEVSHR